jgi:hypothetical protein
VRIERLDDVDGVNTTPVHYSHIDFTLCLTLCVEGLSTFTVEKCLVQIASELEREAADVVRDLDHGIGAMSVLGLISGDAFGPPHQRCLRLVLSISPFPRRAVGVLTQWHKLIQLKRNNANSCKLPATSRSRRFSGIDVYGSDPTSTTKVNQDEPVNRAAFNFLEPQNDDGKGAGIRAARLDFAAVSRTAALLFSSSN